MASGGFWETETHGALRRMLSERPAAPAYNPTADAVAKAKKLGDAELVAALSRFASMPASTGILANPALHEVPVDCAGHQVTLSVRSFGIRGILNESDIVTGQAGPLQVIFIGLFGRRPRLEPFDEATVLGRILDRHYRRALGLERPRARGSLIDRIAEFVLANPGLGPEVTMQYVAVLRKGERGGARIPERAINDERRAGNLLLQLLRVHAGNIAAGGLSIYANRMRRENKGIDARTLAAKVRAFVEAEARLGKNLFQMSYSLLLGRSANDTESRILERMGVIQTHHGSAGSNMVARYLTTLHCMSVSDFFSASQMVMDGERHFGAIHDMTQFIVRLESLPAAARDQAIKDGVLEGGLPTFGHPEIAAAGRGDVIEQDPRAAIYLDPLFAAIDSRAITLSTRQLERLRLIQRIYQIAFVSGVVKPGREDKPPLRLTPNTDFGAWAVQEALGIYGASRTYLTYVFRGFGWMMDCREQMQQKIIRPVIAPDPTIVPTDRSDHTIPDVVVRMHSRLAAAREAFVATPV